MITDSFSLDRRTVLRLGLATVALGALGSQAVAADATQTSRSALEPGSLSQKVAIPAPRYLFACLTDNGTVAGLSQLEAVWAFTGYMGIISCLTTYVGPGSYALTPEESAIVAVAEGQGMVVADRPALYLTILETCTRIPPSLLPARLAELGPPVVKAALVRAPEAPQAMLLRAWLDQNGGSNNGL